METNAPGRFLRRTNLLFVLAEERQFCIELAEKFFPSYIFEQARITNTATRLLSKEEGGKSPSQAKGTQ
jgi:hypothetical protein